MNDNLDKDYLIAKLKEMMHLNETSLAVTMSPQMREHLIITHQAMEYYLNSLEGEDKVRGYLETGIKSQEKYINEIKYFGEKEPYRSKIIMCAYARDLLKGALNVLDGLDPKHNNE